MSLVSAKKLLSALEILTLQFVEGVFGIVQTKLPTLAGVEVRMEIQLEPLSVVYSSLTFATLELIHFMVSDFPTIKFSPPFGLLSLTIGKTIEKTLSLTSAKETLSAPSLILTLQFEDETKGILQRNFPSAAGIV